MRNRLQALEGFLRHSNLLSEGGYAKALKKLSAGGQMPIDEDMIEDITDEILDEIGKGIISHNISSKEILMAFSGRTPESTFFRPMGWETCRASTNIRGEEEYTEYKLTISTKDLPSGTFRDKHTNIYGHENFQIVTANITPATFRPEEVQRGIERMIAMGPKKEWDILREMIRKAAINIFTHEQVHARDIWPKQESEFHTTKSGETIESIARKERRNPIDYFLANISEIIDAQILDPEIGLSLTRLMLDIEQKKRQGKEYEIQYRIDEAYNKHIKNTILPENIKLYKPKQRGRHILPKREETFKDIIRKNNLNETQALILNFNKITKYLFLKPGQQKSFEEIHKILKNPKEREKLMNVKIPIDFEIITRPSHATLYPESTAFYFSLDSESKAFYKQIEHEVKGAFENKAPPATIDEMIKASPIAMLVDEGTSTKKAPPQEEGKPPIPQEETLDEVMRVGRKNETIEEIREQKRKVFMQRMFVLFKKITSKD